MSSKRLKLKPSMGRSVQRSLVAMAAAVCGFEVAGQEILAPLPVDHSATAPAPRTNPTQNSNLSVVTTPPQKVPAWLEWGPVLVRPHPLYRLIYGDGIPSSPGKYEHSIISEFSPGVLFELGKKWSLDYTPTLRLYSNNHFKESTDHSVMLNGATTWDDWSFGLSQGYAYSSQPLVETGTQTEQSTYDTSLSGSYFINSTVSLELGLSQSIRNVGQSIPGQELTDSRQWATMDWLNYELWPGLSAALGVGTGYINLSAGSDMTYEQYQGRISWQPRDKLSLVLNGGLEDRQFLSSQAPDLLNPIYGVAIQYQLFEQTTLSINASRAVSASIFQSQVTESTDVSGSLRQRLFKVLNLDLSGGYIQSSYKSSIPLAGASRTDDGTYLSARLGTSVLKRGTVSVFYYARENSSNDAGFKTSSHQVGLELGYRF